MIPFIHLSSRAPGLAPREQSLKPLLIAMILGSLLLFQVGLVLWVYIKQW